MRRSDLEFARPHALEATAPPENRGLGRDGVRLLVTTPEGHTHAAFRDLPDFLEAGDLLVVNRSATLPASLAACGAAGDFIVNFSTPYGAGVWLVEPRWGSARPGPLPLQPGERIEIGGMAARLIAPYPGLPALWFTSIEGDVLAAMRRRGEPIRYGYITEPYPLEAYQTIFASALGSAEMPSAARPFSARVLDDLKARGIRVAEIILHTGVSSQEVEADEVESQPLYPEPFSVSEATAEAINRTREEGKRVIAVGTTVVRAVESASNGNRVRPATGFTRLFVHPERGVHAIDGMLTGFHDPLTSHLAMLYAMASPEIIHSAYDEAIREQYLWHEFGDSHLILRSYAR